MSKKKVSVSTNPIIQAALEYHEKVFSIYGANHRRTKDSLEYVEQLQTIYKGK